MSRPTTAVLTACFLCAAACEGVPEPSNAEVEAPEWETLALGVVTAEWSERLEEDIGTLPTVRWFSGDCLVYDAADPRCYYGATWSDWPGHDEIHLLTTGPPASTALAHESLHWGLYILTRNSDADHRSRAWRQLGEVEDALTAATPR